MLASNWFQRKKRSLKPSKVAFIAAFLLIAFSGPTLADRIAQELQKTPSVEGFSVVDETDGSICYQGPSKLRKKLEDQNIGLVVLRHGQSESNQEAERLNQTLLYGQSESALTANGERQAKNCSELLIEDLGGVVWLRQLERGQIQPPLVVSSNLVRASQTAEILVSALEERTDQELQLILDDRLRETNFGDFERRPLNELKAMYPDFVKHWRPPNDLGTDYLHRFPGGESRLDLIRRVSQMLAELAEKYPRRTIVLVSHSECLIALRAALGLAPSESGKIRAETSVFANARPYWVLRPSLGHQETPKADRSTERQAPK
jgi:broad specificity phosphatase PhoE